MEKRTSSGKSKRYGLGPERRVKKRREFLETQRVGRRLQSKHLLIYITESRLPHSRLGITVSKKVDSRSVARNLLRRRLREVFRLNQARLTSNFDIIVIARAEAQHCNFEQLQRELLGALRHRGCLN